MTIKTFLAIGVFTFFFATLANAHGEYEPCSYEIYSGKSPVLEAGWITSWSWPESLSYELDASPLQGSGLPYSLKLQFKDKDVSSGLQFKCMSGLDVSNFVALGFRIETEDAHQAKHVSVRLIGADHNQVGKTVSLESYLWWHMKPEHIHNIEIRFEDLGIEHPKDLLITGVIFEGGSRTHYIKLDHILFW
jgi:hypothetical protein